MDTASLFSGEQGLFSFLLAGAVVKFYGLYQIYRGRKELTEQVGRVTGLTLHPVKSCGGLSVQQMDCTPFGVHVGNIYDRHWAIYVPTDKRCVTGGRVPKLVLIQPSIHGDQLHLDAPDMDTLKVPLEPPTNSKVIEVKVIHSVQAKGVDCGDAAAEWVSAFLQTPGLRLITSPTWLEKRKVMDGHSIYHQRQKEEYEAAFHDESALSLGTEASLTDLNNRMKSPVPMETMRVTIKIATDGCPAYDEDTWTEVYIGTAKFSTLMPLPRCVSCLVDPDTGKRREHNEPLTTLRKYRLLPDLEKAGAAFGTILNVDIPGSIKVGDPVYVFKAHKDWWRAYTQNYYRKGLRLNPNN